jgi:Phage tail assembly chaperone protein
MAMKVYNYDPSGLLQGSSDAFPDPMKEGDYLLPAFSTFTAPPTAPLETGQRYKWNGSTWIAATDPAWQLDQERIAREAAEAADKSHREEIAARNMKIVFFYDTAHDNRVIHLSTWLSSQPDENSNEPLYNGKVLADPANAGIQYVLKDQAVQTDLMTEFGGAKYRINDNSDVVARDEEAVRADTLEVAWSALRAQRDTRLGATDWLMLPDVPISPENKEEFIAYRQALRDLPQNTTDPYNPVWPVAPEYGGGV